MVGWYYYKNVHFEELIKDENFKETVRRDKSEVVDKMGIQQIYENFV
jgi:hypothetical protein